MNLLLAMAVIALITILPLTAYSDSADYTMYGWGYGVASELTTVSLHLDLTKQSIGKVDLVQGRFIVDEQSYPLRSLVFLPLFDERFVKINAVASDASLNLTGRLVAESDDGMVYDLRGTITRNNIREMVFVSAVLHRVHLPMQETAIPSPTNQNDSIMIEDKLDALLLVRHKTSVQWRDSYDFTVRVFDPALNPGSNFYNSIGFLEGVQITAKVTDTAGRLVNTINGTTDNAGYFTGSVIIHDNSITGLYTLDVLISDSKYNSQSQRLAFVVNPVY
ncbi:MAG: hypothetical protein QXW91_05185 [Candidatus Nitrosotenuis sp.]